MASSSGSDGNTTLSGPALPPRSGNVRRIVVLLHGVGSNGQDLLGLAPLWADVLPDTLFVSPNAPQRYDMLPPGYEGGYQWFSLQHRDAPRLLAGAEAARPVLDQWLDSLLARYGVPDTALALVGFSQGTMMALHAAPRRARACAGVVGFSGALLATASAETPRSTPPICLIHGMQDDVVPFGAMTQAEQSLRAQGLPVESHARPALGHSIDDAGVQLAGQFLARVLGQ